jgi:hypothetical protein
LCFDEVCHVNTPTVQTPLDFMIAVAVALILIGVLAYDGWVGSDKG